ncbi:glycoside hydrolase family 15 protein [Nocardioides ganghwensis]|jgi:GH15 family glucan-1,4-alpha-glucosidase|uniref:Glycoside hydrolase family 15 protein n=1 Tax=Nocardioides ganghwensis TaxID=252230 RepID=A0A4Q2S8Y5_9ACTN|nr:glycoside hydrolase family 15 protein [Nocardioides ganghwensis]MBD3945631.1 glycoside hydrolase family 15 protein [Nocardioides ganghwensis]RYB99663.1 glycoside hydrolase family 15 protein [Nocardioides ganghwensis]
MGRDRGSGPAALPIAEHGLVGDLRTAALVATDGTIDWFCPGRFDAPSVFASIIDPGAGSWRLRPEDEDARSQQYYHPETNILITRFMTERGVVEVHDFMPVLRAHDPDHRQRLVRRVVGLRGSVDLAMSMAPRPDYGTTEPGLDVADGVVRFADGDVHLALSSTVDLDVDDCSASARLSLRAGESALFVLEVLAPDEPASGCGEGDVDELFDATAAFWRSWLSQSTYTGRWREWIDRSALTLKLLCHEPTGGIIAAPTTSLPESIGGTRNWDYRYVWVRDAAFSVYALLRLGFTDEAAAFVRFLSERLGEAAEDGDDELGPLRVLYDLDGNLPHERELDHLAGHRGSRPVRVGNGAVDQLQLDVYGELIDSVYLFDKHGRGISHDAWSDLRRIVAWLMDNWERPDAGMWEIRAEPRTHTTSLVMSWVAVERMMRVARRRGLPSDLTELAATRDAIYERVMTDCWNDELGAFTAFAGGDVLDAGALLMPMVKMLAPDDPRFLSTLAKVEERLVSDSLVLRYDPEAFDDGVPAADGEGTFSLASFWYVEALTRAGRLADARLALEKMFTYANHLGQYAEQVGLNGEQLGNFPQGFTHLSLISAVINLDRSLDA